VNSQQRTIDVLIADDHPLMREGIAAVISSQPDMRVVGEAADGHEAIALYRKLRPHVTLIDLQMPHLNGMDAIAAIRAEFPQACLTILTTFRGDARAMQAIKSGAQGYLLKSSLRKELTDAIRVLAAGHRYIPSEIAGELARHLVASGARHYEQFDELLAALDEKLGGNTKATVLVKGSRFMKMERVVQHLTGSTTIGKGAH